MTGTTANMPYNNSKEKGSLSGQNSQETFTTENETRYNSTVDDISVKEDNKYDDGEASNASSCNTSDDDDDFDWDEEDPEENDTSDEHLHKHRHFFLCLSRSSSIQSWLCYIVLTAISVAVCVAVFVTVKPQRDPTMTSYNLALWFTFIAFMFCVTFVVQMVIEIIPWIVKKIVGIFASHKVEVFRARLAYYTALRTYSKLIGIGAWTWGSWAFLQRNLELPDGATKPPYVYVLEKVWECFFLLTLLIFIEKFILQLIVTSFHKKAYGERLYKNERALRILDRLKRVKRTLNPQDFLLKKIKKKRSDKTKDSITTATTQTQQKPDFVPKSIINKKEDESNANVKFPSNKNMDTLIAIPPVNTREEPEEAFVETPKEITSDDNKKGYFTNFTKKIRRSSLKKTEAQEQENIEKLEEAEEERLDRNMNDSENQGHDKFERGNTDYSSTYSFSLSNQHSLFETYKKMVQEKAFQDPVTEAKHLAKRIFHNVMGRNPARQYVIESDFYPFFRTIENAREAFYLFDVDSNGDISKREMRGGCIRIYRDRKDLTRSMRDMSQATGKLDVILVVITLCIWAIVVMAVFGVNVGTQLTPLWSAFIAASFIFGNSAKDAFESIIFVFVTHPFDTGDRIFIGSENWVVKNVGLSVSTFLKWDGSVVYVKNSVLATQYIINCRRTGRTTEPIDLQISYKTESWKIQALRDHMRKWCNTFPKLYTKDSCDVNINAFENLNRITLTFYIEHTKNWQEASGRWLRHNNFMLELKDELQRLDIKYSYPEQPVVQKFPGDDSDEEGSQGSSYGDDNDKLRKRVPWANSKASRKRAKMGSTNNNVLHDFGDNDGDAGADAGAAATVTLATGLI